MRYAFTLDFNSKQDAQLWIETIFDLSAVSVLGIWQSPIRDQHIAKVEVIIDEEIVGTFDDALNRMVRPGYNPDSYKDRKLLYWEKIKV
jgi:hypothetical protein